MSDKYYRLKPMKMQVANAVLRDLASLKKRGWTSCLVGWSNGIPIAQAWRKPVGQYQDNDFIGETAPTPEAALAKLMERVEASE